jgi:aryl-alcohol dehydrogenase-like predicted oxidoreductase
MQRRPIGQTGLSISVIAMGCGPVADLMTGTDTPRQLAVVRQAIASGINWFDTAPGYGDGQSERSLGQCLAICDTHQETQIGTKVRLLRSGGESFREQIHGGLRRSLERLGRSSVALLQLHNAITSEPGEQPFSVTPQEVLEPGGIADCMDDLREAGLIRAVGLTGTGSTAALADVIVSGRFQTIQLPLNLLHTLPDADPQPLQILATCQATGVSVLAIRIFAAGALLGRPPGAHTLRTPFFPLSLYQRDAVQSAQLCGGWTLGERLSRAVAFPLNQQQVSAAIIGWTNQTELIEITHSLQQNRG